MENSEKILKPRNSIDITFTKFKNDINYIKDDTKNIIDVEEIGDDFKHRYKKCC